MENNNTEKSRKKSLSAGTVFVLMLFAVMALLFLFSDAGESIGANIGLFQTVYEPVSATASPDETISSAVPHSDTPAAHSVLSTDAFFARAKEYGAKFAYSFNTGNERSAQYLLTDKISIAAELTLSLSTENVSAYMLVCDIPVEPAPLPPDAGNILTMAHEKEMQEYEANMGWIIDSFLSCALAIDTENSTSHAELSLVGNNIRTSIEENDHYETHVGRYDVFCQPDGQGRVIIVVRAAE